MKCPIHGNDCPGDDGGFLIDGNHPDDMYSIHELDEPATDELPPKPLCSICRQPGNHKHACE